MPTDDAFASQLGQARRSVLIDQERHAVGSMRTRVNLDDELVARAQELTGTVDKRALVRDGPRGLIEREAARRLAQLGGTESEFGVVPRRRDDSS